jgi:two-component system phosphate regulon sensor histidine kinase PhoR
LRNGEFADDQACLETHRSCGFKNGAAARHPALFAMRADRVRSAIRASSMMRLGFGTVLWGRRIDDLDYALDIIAACGYRGVEFAQHHEQIFVRKEDGSGVRSLRGIDDLLSKLHSRGLALIGLVSGTLPERTAFLGAHRDAYLYLDRWPAEEAIRALEEGFTLALHPHWLMPLRKLRQAFIHINEAKGAPYADRLRLLIDSAHAVIAEDDPAAAVRRHHHLLAGVHLKSWKPDYGRWSHRYAHGFCPAGEGIVDVEGVVDALHEKGYSGWVIMEQDHYDVGREQTALRCAQWMEEHGPRWGIDVRPNLDEVNHLIGAQPRNPFSSRSSDRSLESLIVAAVAEPSDPAPESLDTSVHPTANLRDLLSELYLGWRLSPRVAHRPDPPEFYRIVAESVRTLLNSAAVKVWSYNPSIDGFGEFCLLGVDAPKLDTTGCLSILAGENSLAGRIHADPRIREFDVRDPAVAEQFVDTRWLEILRESAPWLTVLPVFNASNTRQLRYLITCANRDPLLHPVGSEEYDMEKNRERLPQLEAIINAVAAWADLLTNGIYTSASAHTNYLCGLSSGGVTEFVDALTAYLEETFQCAKVAVFLEDITGTRLDPVGASASKIEWLDERHYYSAEDGDAFTWNAWKFREMIFSSSANPGRAREKCPAGDERNEILFAPLVSWGGHCHGVLRLHNKCQPSGPVASMFNDDDAAKFDAIILTALPHLELLKLQQNQKQSLARMVHEFQSPLVAIRGAVDLMQTDLARKGEPPEKFFRRDFLDDILQWTELMGRLTRNAKIFSGGATAETIQCRKTFLLSEVVMPVLRQIRPLVPHGIRFDADAHGLREIPPLWIDRHQMQQVFFNLFANSLKYGGSKETVRVSISGGPVGRSYCIFFQDLGIGLDEKIKEEIFHPGFRGDNAVLSDVSGQGLGLYVVRTILQAHGANIHVHSCRNPTTFEISLPQTLRYQPPSKDRLAHE